MISNTVIVAWLKSNKIVLFLLLIILLASFLRIYNLCSQSLWLDEGSSVYEAKRNISSLIGELKIHPPLYYIILHYWTLLFGTSEAAIRSLSVCFGIISILVLYKLGRELFDHKAALLASFLLAISTFAIAYSQEARSYSLLLLLTLVSFLFFIRILKADKPRKTHLLLYSLTNILLAYTHMYGLFTIGSQVLYFLLFRRRYAQALWVFWSAQVITLFLYSPWIYVLVTRTFQGPRPGMEWIPEPTFRTVAISFRYLTGAEYLWLPLGAIFVLTLFSLSLTGVFYSQKGQQQQGLNKCTRCTWLKKAWASVAEPKTTLLLMWFLFPLVASLILSFTYRPIFVIRYLIGITPAMYLLVSRGINYTNSFINTRTTRLNLTILTLVVLITLISLPGIYSYYAYPHKEQWREAVHFIAQEYRPDDAIVFNMRKSPKVFEYYYNGNTQIWEISPAVIENEEPIIGIDRLWLVIRSYESTENNPLKNKLLARYGSDSLILQKEFVHVAVYLFDLTPQNTANTEGDRQSVRL